MDYEMEELLPIVARLADQYTSKESTSVSYERARQLMEAVLYCINQCKGEGQLADRRKLTAREAYQCGYEALVCKVENARKTYNELIMEFCGYGTENYQSTVEKAIPGFFRYYDVRFAPQETIITMDYPTICPLTDECGIDAVSKYIEYVCYEQRFMKALPQDYIQGILYRFQSDYQKHFFNICRIVLRHILSHMIVGKKLVEEISEKDYEQLKRNVLNSSTENLEKLLSELLDRLIKEKYDGNQMLKDYLQNDLKDFCIEIQNAARNNSIAVVMV